MKKYDETNVPSPEYRVIPVIRRVVTCYYFPYESRDGSHGSDGSSCVVGEFTEQSWAQKVAQDLGSVAGSQHEAWHADTDTLIPTNGIEHG